MPAYPFCHSVPKVFRAIPSLYRDSVPKHCRVLVQPFCAKPKEINPVKLIFSQANAFYSVTQICNLKWHIKIHWARLSIVEILIFD